jgi:heme exporter protein A
MLSTNELSCQRGRQQLWGNLNLEVTPGELLFVKGANGNGKTSLLKILAGLLSPDNGQVLWQQQAITKDPYAYRDQLLYIGHQTALKPEMSAIENLIFLASLHGLRYSETEITEALKQWDLQGKTLHLPCRQLSQGQKQRVALAQLNLSQQQIWILDEPLNALDQATSEAIETKLLRHAAENGIIVFSSHLPLALATQYSQYRTIDLNAKP